MEILSILLPKLDRIYVAASRSVDPNVRGAIANALVKMNGIVELSADAKEAIERLMHDNRARVRSSAKKSLIKEEHS